MLMPETPIYQYNYAKPGKNQIWPTGQIPDMQTVSQTALMQSSPDCKFRLGIFSPDR